MIKKAIQPQRQFGVVANWRVGSHIWPHEDVAAARPQLRVVLSGIAGTLEQHGLAGRMDQTTETFQQLDKEIKQIRHQIQSLSHKRPVWQPLPKPLMTKNQRIWVRTELGEHVLAFYSDAAMAEASKSE